MFVFPREIWSWFWAALKIDQAILSYLVSYYYTVRSGDVKVLKSCWNFVKTKTTTPGKNICTLLITFIAFTSFISPKFQTLFFPYKLSYTLGLPVVTTDTKCKQTRTTGLVSCLGFGWFLFNGFVWRNNRPCSAFLWHEFYKWRWIFLFLYNSYSSENLYLPDLYPEFDLQNSNEDECLTDLRFKTADIPRLARALQIPDVIRCYQGTIATGLNI